MPTEFNIFSAIVSIFYIIIFLTGLINTIAPKWLWKKFDSWKATKEPSNAYFLIRRISGIIVMIIIATIALFPSLISYFDK